MRYILLLGLIVSSLYAGTPVYTCNFEQNEQGSAFALGDLYGQGTPSWGRVFQWADEQAGEIQNWGPDYCFTGTQGLYQFGLKSAVLDLGAYNITTAKWFEFAFMPYFPDNDPEAMCRAVTVAGVMGDAEGIHMQLTCGTRAITCDGVYIGDFVNKQWHTISFEHEISNYTWTDLDGVVHNTIYTGTYKVYLNGVYKATVISTSGNLYSSIGVFAFRTSSPTWANNGEWFVDGVYLGDEWKYKGPLDCGTAIKMGLELSGDLNSDCIVDTKDLDIIADSWLNVLDNYYHCGFEPGEQGSAFVANDGSQNSLNGQGTPAWHNVYQWVEEQSGAVVNWAGYSNSGTQMLYQYNMNTAWLNMGSPKVAKWFEFAFYSWMTDPLAMSRAVTISGVVGNVEGIHMQLMGDGSIACDGTSICSVSRNEWHTISFEHETTNYAWTDSSGISHDTIYTGNYNVYVDGVYKATTASLNGYNYGYMQTFAFRTSTDTWSHTGQWMIDDVYVGPSSHFVDGTNSGTMDDCGGLGWNEADINGNCKVDFEDFALLADEWLESGDPLVKGSKYYVPKVALIRSDFKYERYEPGSLWLSEFNLTGCDVTELDTQNVAVWCSTLSNYDIIMFSAYYANSPLPSGWSSLYTPLRNWIQSGGLLIMEGVRSDKAPIAWLSNVQSTWQLTVNDRLSGLPAQIDSSLLTPHPLTDGVEVIAYNVGRAFASAPDFVNGGLTVPVNGSVLARNKNDRPTMWSDTLGSGRVIVTNYFKGYGLDAVLMENILMWAGMSHTARITDGPTIAQQVATVSTNNSSPIDVTFSGSGVMQIDGTSFFPFGFFNVTNTDSMQMMQSDGFNYAWDNASAWTYGLRHPSLLLIYQSPTVGIPNYIAEGILDQGRVCYGISEEPGNTGMFTNYQLRLASQAAKKVDPTRPTYIMCNNPAEFELLGDSDIMVIDPYYVLSSSSSLNGIANDIKTAKSVSNDKPVWTLLQAHSFSPVGQPKPTPAQLTAEMYVALASGSKGISWFILDDNGDYTCSFLRNGSGWIADQNDQSTRIIALAQEFNTIKSYLTGSDSTVQVAVTSPSSGVYALCFTRTASPQNLLIVVNAEATSKSNVTVSWPLSVSSNTKVFSDSPNISVNTGTHTITIPSMAGYQRGAYTFSN
ncbi:MAG: hypothetical protein A2Y12_00010 [Planctomycetes bacterium GWF2_42_9]|nr:MAG: hypothetical protein A2Y12_00010 [Planctomycetes bacterium GWF2_42_9]